MVVLAAYPSLAQEPTPASSPLSPVVTPITPTASPAIEVNAYRAARTPTLTLPLSSAANMKLKGIAHRVAKLEALASGTADAATPSPKVLKALGGVFDEVSIGYFDGTQTPDPVEATLQFDASSAGTVIWIQTLDGGAILTKDSEGKTVASKEGVSVVLDSQGQAIFSFQALSRPGRYQVSIRMDNISTILPFVLLDPNEEN